MKNVLATVIAVGSLCLALAPAFAGNPSKVHITPARPMSARAMSSGVRAMALINADGSIAYTKGITAVTVPATGLYCVTLTPKISSTTAVPVMSFNYDSSPDLRVFITFSPSLDCPANSLGILTYTTDSGSVVYSPEGFTIIVP